MSWMRRWNSCRGCISAREMLQTCSFFFNGASFWDNAWVLTQLIIIVIYSHNIIIYHTFWPSSTFNEECKNHKTSAGFHSRIQVLGELVRFQERAKEQNAMKYAKLKRAWVVMMLGGLRLFPRPGVHDTQFLVILVGKMMTIFGIPHFGQTQVFVF